jgi:hypothetical protein
LLKHSGERGVSVGHNCSLPGLSCGDVSQGLNDITKHGEGLVDGVTLIESLSRGLGLTLLLRSGQVHNVDHGAKSSLFTSHLGDLGVVDCDDCVSTRTGGIHGSGSHGTIGVTHVDDTLNLLIIGAWLLLASLHENLGLGLTNLERGLLCSWHEEIENFLHIDLNHLHSDFKADIILLVLVNLLEDFNSCQWDDSLVLSISEDRVRLSSSSLSIGEERNVQSGCGLRQKYCSQKIPNPLLVCVLGSRISTTITILIIGESIVRPESMIKGILLLWLLA